MISREGSAPLVPCSNAGIWEYASANSPHLDAPLALSLSGRPLGTIAVLRLSQDGCAVRKIDVHELTYTSASPAAREAPQAGLHTKRQKRPNLQFAT